MFFWRKIEEKSVKSIVSDLYQKVEDLVQHKKEQEEAIVGYDEQMSNLINLKSEASKEAQRAQKVSENLSKLLGEI